MRLVQTMLLSTVQNVGVLHFLFFLPSLFLFLLLLFDAGTGRQVGNNNRTLQQRQSRQVTSLFPGINILINTSHYRKDDNFSHIYRYTIIIRLLFAILPPQGSFLDSILPRGNLGFQVERRLGTWWLTQIFSKAKT